MATVDLLVRQYLQQVEPPLLPLPDGPTIIQPAVQSAIYEHMFDEASAWPLPPVNYRTRVLKVILFRIEEAISDPEEDEVQSDLMETWGTLISQPKPSAIQQAQQLSYIRYTSPNPAPPTPSPRTIITSESRGLILASGTTGFRTWEAALHLGTYLSTPAGEALVSGKRVIELGAGTGFAAMFCAAHLNPQYVLATDREPALIDSIRHCARRNKLGRKFGATIWDWGTPLDERKYPDEHEHDDEGNDNNNATQTSPLTSGSDSPNPGFDVALGADLIYDVDLIPLLLSTIHDLFDNYGIKEFVISATLRNQDTFRCFLEGCENNNFNTECIPFESPAPTQQTGFFHSTDIPIQMYRVTPKSG